MINKPKNIYTKDSITNESMVRPPVPQTKSISNRNNGEFVDTDVLPQSIYDNLPVLLKDSCSLFNDQYEKDVFLFGALTVLGGSFHKLFAFNDVDKKKVATNLMTFIVARPVSGKGALNYSKRLLAKIKSTFATNSKKLGSKSKSQLIIPVDNSSSGVIEMLSQNNGIGVMIETEIDTLVNANKQDWGNYSNILRYSFENESCSFNRKGEKETVNIEQVKMALAISGTTNQFKSLMYSAENGLFSRGCYYVFQNDDIKLKCFDRINSPIDLEEQFASFATRANEFYEKHLSFESIKIVFTRDQLSKVQDVLQKEYDKIINEDLRANVARSFIIVQKIASLLEFLEQCEKSNLSESLFCSDKSLSIAIDFALTSLRHSYKAYEILPQKSNFTLTKNEYKLFHLLSDDFERGDALNKMGEINIQVRSIDNCIKAFKKKGMIEEIGHGKFKKVI